jgi:hypothetical protein
MASNLTAQVRPEPADYGQGQGHSKRQHTVAEIAEAVNGAPTGLFHQYREVPERTGQIAPKVPRHLTMKVTGLAVT